MLNAEKNLISKLYSLPKKIFYRAKTVSKPPGESLGESLGQQDESPVESPNSPPVESSSSPPGESQNKPPGESPSLPPVESPSLPPGESSSSPPVEPPVEPPVQTPEPSPFFLYALLQHKYIKKQTDKEEADKEGADKEEADKGPITVEITPELKPFFESWKNSGMGNDINTSAIEASTDLNGHIEKGYSVHGCFAYGDDFSTPYRISSQLYRRKVNKKRNFIKNNLNGYKKPKDMKIGEKILLHHTSKDDSILATIQHIFKLNIKLDSSQLANSSPYILFILTDELEEQEHRPLKVDLRSTTSKITRLSSKKKRSTKKNTQLMPSTHQLILYVRGEQSIRIPDNSVFDKGINNLASFFQKGGKKHKTHKKRTNKYRRTSK